MRTIWGFNILLRRAEHSSDPYDTSYDHLSAREESVLIKQLSQLKPEPHDVRFNGVLASAKLIYYVSASSRFQAQKAGDEMAEKLKAILPSLKLRLCYVHAHDYEND